MQAVTIGAGWSYQITYDILNGNEGGLFQVAQVRNAGKQFALYNPEYL